MSFVMRIAAYVLILGGLLWFAAALGVFVAATFWACCYHGLPFESDVLNVVFRVLLGAFVSAPYSLPGLLVGGIGVLLLWLVGGFAQGGADRNRSSAST